MGRKGGRGQWGVNNAAAALREEEKGRGEVKERENGNDGGQRWLMNIMCVYIYPSSPI